MTSLLRHSSSIDRVLREALLLGVCLAAWSANATSEQQHIYRCGNAYTNQPDPAGNCKPLVGGSVTVIEGTRVQGPQAASSSVNAGGGSSVGAARVDSADQRQRDLHAQVVLQAELQRAKQQQAELLREWNNGEPERRADEHRQPQKYQERVAQLRVALQRIDADVAGLQRELARLPAPASTGAKP
ncbi:hypothetical protein B9Z35_06445 [Limnohabitans sp. Jir61]|uniref:hypothetical protein n=1 Tax=Limnohabitans sp. Jir61 TaxID=1826168 RepID=UPI000D3B991D|nr:hypothetical protein [Limnohabitans sp. Jir61]PUE30693.1 hypothetical protein B9Z35_06445 [Limnohabitans sp. Jir61]